MIREVTGNILTADVEALVNPVNTVGVMGAGLAKQVKLAYPGVFREYVEACRSGLLAPGCVMAHRVNNPTGSSCLRYIISFPTKQDWRNPSRLVRDGLVSLRDTLKWIPIDNPALAPIRSIALPCLGCGLGGLDWAEVRELIHAKLGDLHEIEILLYTGTPPAV